MGNASVSWKTHLGGTVNQLTMSDIRCVPTENKDSCPFPAIQHMEKDQKKYQHKNTL